jgi:glycosyltransferase involved in cell wall biosynthesis
VKILLITPYYPPEIGGAAHLMYELAISLKAKGHAVKVLTGYPRYNIKVAPPRYRRSFWMTEFLDGIEVKRTRILTLPRSSMIGRGLEHFFVGLWLGALAAVAPRGDVAMVLSPPLPLPWMIALVGKVRRMPVVVNIQDLFPREAVEMGMLTNPLLIRLFETMERQVYALAARVTVHSPGNKDHVVRQGGKRERVEVVGNWVDLDRIRPGARDNAFSRQYGLGNRFVVSYAGTMGWAQDMGTIVKSAALLRDRKEIVFLFVGDGVEKGKAQAMSLELGLENMLWLPTQPWTVYPEILSASDACLINLCPELRTPVVPSKLLSIMAAGRPVIASLPAESDARRMIADGRCGIAVDAGDGQALADAIAKLASDRALGQEMGRMGRIYAERNLSRDFCTGQMESVMKNAIGDVQ